MARTRSPFDEPIAAPQPASDAYTGLLALSLLAMIASCVILYLDYAQYGTNKAPSVNIPAPGPKTPAINQGSPVSIHTPTVAPTIVPAVAIEPEMPKPVAVEPAMPTLLPPPS